MNKKKENTGNSLKSRLIRCAFFSYVLLTKMLFLPSSWFSPRVQQVKNNWTKGMLWTFISSLGTKAYMDQPCRYKKVTNQPKAQVDERYRLSPEQIESFHKNGFLGPLTAVSEAEMAIFQNRLESELEMESKAFGIKTVRDRHLDAPFIFDLFSQPAITEVLAQLLGPDLLMWRSQVFNQLPGAPPITWHQASTYMLEDYKRPILNPDDRNDLFQLTVWIAVDDANLGNGCMQFIPGTHDKIRKVKLRTDNQFYRAKFEMDEKINPDDAVAMPLRPGQFVVFSERCIHGNPGNRSANRRMGINFRAITTSTSVYAGQEKHYATHLDTSWDLKNWGVVSLRGEDKYRLSKHKDLSNMETA